MTHSHSLCSTFLSQLPSFISNDVGTGRGIVNIEGHNLGDRLSFYHKMIPLKY